MLFRRTILYSGLLGGFSHLVSRDFIAFPKGSANGDAQRNVSRKKQ